jgi:hypothetical protein
MHSKSIWRALLLTAMAAFIPCVALAQVPVGPESQTPGEPQVYGEDYAPPDPVWPLPLYSTHPENGGLFVAGSFVSMRLTNPLGNQVVAVRGLTIVDQRSGLPVPTFVGTGNPALDVNEVRGPTDFQPGFKAEIGYKFTDGSTVTVSWLNLTENTQHADATFAAPHFLVGQDFADSFLFSPVANFPNEFAGPSNKILSDVGRVGGSAAPGIWNGASIETEDFTQRFNQWDALYRAPIFETENYRVSCQVGVRLTSVWEKYKWTATDLDVTGNSDPSFAAVYTNVVSNRLYGLHAACVQECYLGHGFAADLTLAGTMYADSIKTQVKYSLMRGAFGADHPGPVSKRSRHRWEPSPEGEVKVGMMWYPIEGVQIHAGYDVQGLFNTMSTDEPIDFNYGTVDPHFTTSKVRFLDGLDLGIALIF